MYRVAFGVTENVLKLYCSDGHTTLNILKTIESFMVYEIDLNKGVTKPVVLVSFALHVLFM